MYSGQKPTLHLLYFLFIAIATIEVTAQRNILDVPTSEIVEYKHIFFQQQFGFADRQIKASTAVTVGLGKGFETGILLNQLTFNERPHKELITIDATQPDLNPDLLITLQKGFKVQKWYTLGIGTRIGSSIAKTWTKVRLCDFTFINNLFSIPGTEHKLVAGAFYANTPYSGFGNHYGWMAGTEIDILPEKLALIADYTSGNNSLAVLNMGFQISLPKSWEIDLGLQLPAPGSNNNPGALVQILRK